MQNNHLIGNVAVHQMSASTNGFAHGGGLNIQGVGNALIVGNEFVSNVTAFTITISGGANGNGGGGGVGLLRTNALIQDNVISNNVAHRAADGGSSGTLGESFGAGVNVQDGTATLERNLILGNRRNATYADGGSSGVWVWNSTLTSTNDILARNFDGIGGGNNATITLINDTLYDNGHIGGFSGEGGAMFVTNTIIFSHENGLENSDPPNTTLIADYNLLSNTTNYVGIAAGTNDILRAAKEITSAFGPLHVSRYLGKLFFPRSLIKILYFAMLPTTISI